MLNLGVSAFTLFSHLSFSTHMTCDSDMAIFFFCVDLGFFFLILLCECMCGCGKWTMLYQLS